MKQIKSMEELRKEFLDKQNMYALITYKQENFEKEFSEQSRTYMVGSYNRYFESGKIANSLFGSCIDGTDVGVRLDWYNWKIEKIMILETQEEIDKYNSMLGEY